jgi:hypothetical protein
MSELTQSIKELYKGNVSDGEVELAKNNLVGFFKLLQEIDIRLHKEEQSQQNTPQNGIQETLQSNTTLTKDNNLPTLKNTLKPRTKQTIQKVNKTPNKSNLKSNKSQNDNNGGTN